MTWRMRGPLALAATLALANLAPIFWYARQTAPNSDGVEKFLETQAILQGHILLGGWVLPEDSTYFTELPFDLFWAALKGVSPALLYLVPTTVFAVLLFASLALIARAVARPEQGWIAVPAGFALIGMPLAFWPILANCSHIATIAGAILVYLLLRPLLTGRTWRPALVPYLLCVAAVTASDPFAHVFVTAPIVLFFAARMVPIRDARRTSLALAAVTVAAAVAGATFPWVVRLAGGFETQWPISFSFVHWDHWGAVLTAIPEVFGKLAGFVPNFGPPVRWGASEITRAAIVAAAVASCLAVVAGRWRRRDEFILLLILAGAVPIAASAISEQFYDTLTAAQRYLAPSYILLSIAAAIAFPDLIARFRSEAARGMALSVAGVAALALWAHYVAAAWPLAAQPPAIATIPQRQLADWLIARRLTYGVGDFWAARTADALGGGAFLIASVTAKDGRLEPFHWQSSRAEFGPPPQFVVFYEPDIYGITLDTVRATYGPVASVEHVAGMTVSILAPR